MSNTTDKMTAAEFRAMMAGEKLPAASGTPSVNRKVRNATKCERDGVKFDSRIESHMHASLTMHGIPFEFKPKYVLLEPFRYNDEAVRAVTYAPDFYLTNEDMIIDTKGVGTQQGQLRIKLLKRLFADLDRSTTIELPSTTTECDALVARLITNRKNTSVPCL